MENLLRKLIRRRLEQRIKMRILARYGQDVCYLYGIKDYFAEITDAPMSQWMKRLRVWESSDPDFFKRNIDWVNGKDD